MLIFYDGFNDYASNSDLTVGGWTSVGMANAVSADRFSSGRCLISLAGTQYARRSERKPGVAIGALDTAIVGIAASGTGFVMRLCAAADTKGEGIGLDIQANGSVRITKGNTAAPVVLATSSAGAVPGGWNWIELKVGMDGHVVARVNGITVIDQTGVAIGVADMSILHLGRSTDHSPGTSSSINLDDVVLLDATGSAPYNDFLGDIRIYRLRPNSTSVPNDGTIVGSAASKHAALSKDTINTQTPSVELLNEAGKEQRVGFEDLPGTAGVVLAVKSNFVTRKTTVAAASGKIRTVVGAGVSEGTSTSLVDAALKYSEYNTLAPGGAPWTQADVNNVELGYAVT